jgi:hypothetical protein
MRVLRRRQSAPLCGKPLPSLSLSGFAWSGSQRCARYRSSALGHVPGYPRIRNLRLHRSAAAAGRPSLISRPSVIASTPLWTLALMLPVSPDLFIK